MTEELKKHIETLEYKVAELTQKVNEVIAVLNDNDLNRKVGVEYIFPDAEPSEEPAEPEEVKEEEAKA